MNNGIIVFDSSFTTVWRVNWKWFHSTILVLNPFIGWRYVPISATDQQFIGWDFSMKRQSCLLALLESIVKCCKHCYSLNFVNCCHNNAWCNQRGTSHNCSRKGIGSTGWCVNQNTHVRPLSFFSGVWLNVSKLWITQSTLWFWSATSLAIIWTNLRCLRVSDSKAKFVIICAILKVRKTLKDLVYENISCVFVWFVY